MALKKELVTNARKDITNENDQLKPPALSFADPDKHGLDFSFNPSEGVLAICMTIPSSYLPPC
jgi:hypothetical protein